MKKNYVVMSYFDGIGGGITALKCAGISPSLYLASEVEHSAMTISMSNHPEIVQIGDIKKIKTKTLYSVEVYNYLIENYFNNDIHSLQSVISESEMLHRINQEQIMSAYFGAQIKRKNPKISKNPVLSVNDRIWFWRNKMGNNKSIYDIIRCGERRTISNNINIGELCKHSFWWNGNRQQKSGIEETCITGVKEKNSIRRNKREITEINNCSIFNSRIKRKTTSIFNTTTSESNNETTLSGWFKKKKQKRNCGKEKKYRTKETFVDVPKVKNTLSPKNEINGIIETNKNFNRVHPKMEITLVECEWGLIIFKGNFDLTLSGSPCQGFSFAGRRKGMVDVEEKEITTLEQYLNLKKINFQFIGQSYLFWEFIRLVRELKPKYFLLENVLMNKKWLYIISRELNVLPYHFNSNLVSFQNRDRLYWTNIPNVLQPKDLGIRVGYVIPGAIGGFGSRGVNKGNKHPNGKIKWEQKTTTRTDHKVNCITTKKGSLAQIEFQDGSIRYMTVEEAEKAQTLPKGYTNVPGVSQAERWKGIGNGWTISIISHIFNFLRY